MPAHVHTPRPTLNILLVHNYYRSNVPSGENEVFEAEKQLLSGAGHRVIEFTRTNDEWRESPLRTAATASILAAWNPFTYSLLQQRIAAENPDVVHYHNTYPLLSPSVVRAARPYRAARVATLHNYRLFCSKAVVTRDGKPCLDCLQSRSVLPALQHGCYRDNRLATLPVAATIALNRRLGTWATGIDLFVALSEFQKKLLGESGLDADRIRVKPHFAQPGRVVPWPERARKLVCIGRLTEEKGMDLVVTALRDLADPDLHAEIIGDGPLRAELARLIESCGLRERIVLTGRLSREETLRRLAESRLLVMASRSYETFGLPVVEAFAHGVPVLAPRQGSFSALVDEGVTGALFDSGSPPALAAALRNLWHDDGALQRMADAALRNYQRFYAPDANLAQLLAVYHEAIEIRSASRLANHAGLAG